MPEQDLTPPEPQVHTHKPKQKRAAKSKNGLNRAPGRPRKLQFMDESVPKATEEGERKFVYGWPEDEGFSKLMLFPLPADGTMFYPTRWVHGNRPPVTIYKGTMHVLPQAIVNRIIDANSNTIPEPDLSDWANPKTNYDGQYLPFPHSPPVPATVAEFIAFRESQKAKPIFKTKV